MYPLLLPQDKVLEAELLIRVYTTLRSLICVAIVPSRKVVLIYLIQFLSSSLQKTSEIFT